MTEQPRPVRTIRLLRRPHADGIGIFCIQYGWERAFYPFREIRCDIGGRGFAVARWGTRRVYHVRNALRQVKPASAIRGWFARKGKWLPVPLRQLGMPSKRGLDPTATYHRS